MDPVVSVDWLSSRLQGSDVVVLDATLPAVGVLPVVDTHARYLERHIPGAMFFDIEAVSDRDTSLPHMLPTAETFAESMAELGVGSAMTLVLYEQDGMFSAPRAWWMLRTMGVRNVFVLDGGLRAWVEAGYPVESGPVPRQRAAFAAELDAGAVRSFAEIQSLLDEMGRNGHGQIVDARSAGRFTGQAAEPRAGLRSGHMPGALNVPYTALLQDGRLLDVEGLRLAFAARGVDVGQPVTTTCGSGVTAAVLALALERCGARQVSLYDGSWTEYAQQPGAVIATE